MPPTPVVEMMPLGVASPKACVAWCRSPELRAAFDPGGAGHRVDADPVHRREIDDQPVVDSAQPRAVVAAAADGHEDVVVAGEVDRGDDVGDVRALGDEGRVLVDHRVVDRAGLVVAGIAGLDEIAAHGGGQSLDGCFVEGRGDLDRRCHDVPPCFFARDACPSRVLPGLALECVPPPRCTSATITDFWNAKDEPSSP